MLEAVLHEQDDRIRKDRGHEQQRRGCVQPRDPVLGREHAGIEGRDALPAPPGRAPGAERERASLDHRPLPVRSAKRPFTMRRILPAPGSAVNSPATCGPEGASARPDPLSTGRRLAAPGARASMDESPSRSPDEDHRRRADSAETAEVDASRADGTQDAFLVRVHTDEGITGIGETDSSPYLARTAIEMPSSHSVARGVAELLIGEDPLQIDRLWQRVYEGSAYYGRGGLAMHVLSGIDIALWDIAGKAFGQPISELLGGRRVERVRVYASEVMPYEPEDVRALGRKSGSRRLRRLQARLGTARQGPRPGRRAHCRSARGDRTRP